MRETLIILLGNDQKLKDSIYQQYSGNLHQSIPIPYSYQVLNTMKQDNSIRYKILNTPSTTNKAELISIWYNMITISKLEDFEYCVLIYCFTTLADISQLLYDVNIEMGRQIKLQDIMLLTQTETPLNKIDKFYEHNNLNIIPINQNSIKDPLSYIKKSSQLKLSSLIPKIQEQNKSKEIVEGIYNTIFSEWKFMNLQSKTQADFIKYILKEEQISQIVQKLQLNFQSQVQLFNIIVDIRQILEERRKETIHYKHRMHLLENSFFRYCSSKNCSWLYYLCTQKLVPLCQLQIQLKKPTSYNIQCLECKFNTFQISYYPVLDNAYYEFQFRIIYEISQQYQQKDSNQILQIMLLSNEEEEKKNFFNIIQENCTTKKVGWNDRFQQSSIINNKYQFHTSPPFDFEKDSENTTTSFRDYFCKNNIHFFFIFVKQDRTDIMIQRITNLIKKIHNLDRKRMALIVNQFQGEQEDKVELDTRLSYFGFKTIHFFSNDYDLIQCKILFQTLENIETLNFDFTNTIFEQENESIDQYYLKERLIKMSSQIYTEYKNNLRIQLAQDKEQLDKLEMEIRILEAALSERKSQKSELKFKYQQITQKLQAWEKQPLTFKY